MLRLPSGLHENPLFRAFQGVASVRTSDPLFFLDRGWRATGKTRSGLGGKAGGPPAVRSWFDAAG